jgi:UPF0716 protein FxsA
MHILRRIALFLLILPLLEVIVFALVATSIGFWNAILLAVVTSVAGGLLLRAAGQPRMRQFQNSLAGGFEVSSGATGLFTVLAGFLLLLPGFLTDFVAILLLIPAVRRLFGVAIARSMRKPDGPPAAPGVVDLEPGEWRDAAPQSRPQDFLPPNSPQTRRSSPANDSPWRKS